MKYMFLVLICITTSVLPAERRSRKVKSRNTEQREFVCTLCGKVFQKRWNLTRHGRTHSGAQPFSCEGCNRRFGDVSNCRRHKNGCRQYQALETTTMSNGVEESSNQEVSSSEAQSIALNLLALPEDDGSSSSSSDLSFLAFNGISNELLAILSSLPASTQQSRQEHQN